MKILLIAPTALDFQGKPIKQRRIHLPGLTLPILAAVTPKDVHLRLLMETTEDIPFDEHWDAVGLTGMGSGIVRAWQISDEFRKRGVKTIIGGIAASLADPKWSLEHADAVVTGEAEEIWPDVVGDLAANRLKKIYHMDKKPSVDKLPVPRYDLMRRSKIGLWRPVQATRGCPFYCKFCSTTSFFGGTYRKRPIDQIIRDVRAAKKNGTRYIAFIDDNIAIDFDYSADLFEALIPEKIIWMSQCSLHISEYPDLMRLAYKSGCRLLSIGIESTNEGSLSEIDKKWNKPGRYSEAFKVLRENGIDVSTEMIIGFDADDHSVFKRTYDFIIKNKISIPRVHILTPVPGTPLFERMEAEGRILSTDFGRYSGGKVNFRPANINPEMLQAGYWELYKKLFGWRSILYRIAFNQASLSPYMQAVVWAVNLHYKQHVHHRICPGIV
jgi:radical SAM superfamily enzyme YgiQ (UPF0313 family)